MRRLYPLILVLMLGSACGPQRIIPPPGSTATPRTQDATPAAAITLVAPNQLPTSQFTDPVLVLGEQQYNLVCAHCHGYEGQGQLAESIPQTESLGMHTVPAHNADSHVYQHPDQLLIRVIKEGVQNPLDHYPMPAFEGALTDEQINAIIAYMKTWWTEEQRAHQAEITQRWAELDAQLVGAGG
jgi:mono/diheme cytochrome c family protein